MPGRSQVLLALLTVAVLGCTGDSARDVRQYSVEEFYRNTEYFGGSFSHDNTQILVSSNLSGIYNAYSIPAIGGAPEPLTTSSTNAVFAVTTFPADGRLLYSSDEGGNELRHVYVRAPDGSAQDLTPGQRLTASFSEWSGDLKSFFVSTNERDQQFFDIYEYQTDSYARTLFYRNTEGYQPGPISRDKRYLALVKVHSLSNSDVYLYDRKTNTTTLLTKHEGDVSYAPATFTPDGTALLFIADEGREFAALWRLDLATGTRVALLSPDWDVASATFSQSGAYLAVSVNEDAQNLHRVYDARTMAEVLLPGLPPGMIRGLTISRDDSLYLFYNSDGSTPDDLWAGRMGKPPMRLTNALNAGMDRENLVVPTKVRFKSYDSLDIPGLLYRPHQASKRHKVPALVMVHGGPGGQAQVGYSSLTQALVNHGYVVFDINNRGSSGYGRTFFQMDDRKHGEADLGDVVAAKRMLAETGYVDTTKVGIIGGSYGGYMVLAALTLQPDAFDAGVDLFGISNWSRTLTSIPPWWESFRAALYKEMGDPSTDSARLRRISPLFNASSIRAPLMVLQGANDPRVLQAESDEIVAAAKANGVPTEYVVFPDEGHGFVKKENEIKGYSAILTFLDRYLKGSAQAP
jgi:dipeptidyl aminopeptidase/acylaminoacyl peptidase